MVLTASCPACRPGAPTSPADNPIVRFIDKLSPPKWLFRTVACLVLAGQVITRMCQGGRPSLRPRHLAALRPLAHANLVQREPACPRPLLL
jgi:hypothetical protein